MMSKFFDLSLIILNCVEYNDEKLKEYYPAPYSPARTLLIKLELSICHCVMLLAAAEKFYLNPPEELTDRLVKLINNTRREMTAEEQVVYLKSEIKEAVLFVENIKYSMKSKTLQHVEKYLNELLEEKI